MLYLVPSVALALIASDCCGLGQWRRQSGGQRGDPAPDAAGASQRRVLDQAGRRAARRRDRRPGNSPAGRDDRLAHDAGRRGRRRDRRDGADVAVRLAHRPAARARGRRRRLGQLPARPTSPVPLRSLSLGRGLWRAVLGGLSAGDPAGLLGDVRGDLSGGGPGPVAQRRRPRLRGDAGLERDRPRGDGLDRRSCRIGHDDAGVVRGRLVALHHRVRTGHARTGRCGR